MLNDAKIAGIARKLAIELEDAAYTRKDEDKKKVLIRQTELCAAVREEKNV